MQFISNDIESVINHLFKRPSGGEQDAGPSRCLIGKIKGTRRDKNFSTDDRFSLVVPFPSHFTPTYIDHGLRSA